MFDCVPSVLDSCSLPSGCFARLNGATSSVIKKEHSDNTLVLVEKRQIMRLEFKFLSYVHALDGVQLDSAGACARAPHPHASVCTSFLNVCRFYENV